MNFVACFLALKHTPEHHQVSLHPLEGQVSQLCHIVLASNSGTHVGFEVAEVEDGNTERGNIALEDT